jgi:prepilin-type processing-associated H-X9-DG protein
VNTNSGMFPLDGILFPHVAKYPPYTGSTASDPQVYELYQTWSNTQSYNLRFGALFPYLANLNDKAMTQSAFQGQSKLASDNSQFPSLNPAVDKYAAAFMCPADTGFRDSPNAVTLQNNWTTVHIGPEPSGGFWSYSVNSITNSQAAVLQTIFGTNKSGVPQTPWSYPLTSGAINSPQFLIFIEESAQHSNFNDEVMDPVGFNTGDALSERHNGGGNLGFWDGHVQWMSASQYDNVPNTQGDTLAQAEAITPFIHWFFPND